jgi:hypothetical protein
MAMPRRMGSTWMEWGTLAVSMEERRSFDAIED